MEATEVLDRYAELRRIVDEAEAELDKLKPAVVEALEGRDGKYATETFKLGLRRTKKWEYTSVVAELQTAYDTAKKAADESLAAPKKELADAKKNEEKSGLATVVSTNVSPSYKPV